MKCSVLLVALICFASLVSLQSCKEKGAPDEHLLGHFKLDIGAVTISSARDSLDVPWEVQCHNHNLWYSLQKGEIWRMEMGTNNIKKVLTVPTTFRLRTMGALGMNIETVHDSTFVYLVYNTASDTSKLDTTTLLTNLVRYYYNKEKDTLVDFRHMLSWPANTGHNGSRIIIGKENDLFVTAGDHAADLDAQDVRSLNGKVLHLMRDGSVPANNPFPNSYVWSYGHRNQQGLCFGPNNNLYASEHGDATDDEVNLIEKGKNYGWPFVEGKVDTDKEKKKVDSLKLNITEPLIDWTPTIAPAALVYYGNGPIDAFKNSLLLVTLKGSALHVLHLNNEGTNIVRENVYFKNRFGRLRSICLDNDGNIYIGTSNRDWNPSAGYPKSGDDHILRIAPFNESQSAGVALEEAEDKSLPAVQQTKIQDGKTMYMNYCSACHKEDGMGLAGSFPPLNGNPTLKNTEKLITTLSNGRNGKQVIMGNEYSQAMPNFSFLTDEQMTAVVNYLKTNFAKESAVPLDKLKEVRKKVQK